MYLTGIIYILFSTGLQSARGSWGYLNKIKNNPGTNYGPGYNQNNQLKRAIFRNKYISTREEYSNIPKILLKKYYDSGFKRLLSYIIIMYIIKILILNAYDLFKKLVTIYLHLRTKTNFRNFVPILIVL